MKLTPDACRIAIVGAGMMGHGMALSFAKAGYRVSLIDVSEAAVAKGIEWVRSDLGVLEQLELVEPGSASTVVGRIEGFTDFEAGARNAGFAVEAVPDDLESKRNVFRRLEACCPEHTIFATTTASLRIADIASALGRKDRMLGAHWVNPPHIMPLVEVASSDETSEESMVAAIDLFRRIGKKPIRCKDIPGFINNRLLFALLNEGLKILEMGAATPEDIDDAIRYGFGVRAFLYGPFRWSDCFGNIRQIQTAYESLYASTGEEAFRPSALLRRKIESGELGFANGKGWYEYPEGSPATLAGKRAEMLAELAACLQSREPGAPR